MKISKKQRHKLILQIIQDNEIETQEDLVEILRRQNLDITQATISRDIKDMALIKIAIDGGKQKYIQLEARTGIGNKKLLKVFGQAVKEIKVAATIVIIKTLPGMAQAAASALDHLNNPKIIGCIAGDDTIFIATALHEDAKELVEQLTKISDNNA